MSRKPMMAAGVEGAAVTSGRVLRAGQALLGPLFNEPMRVETVSAAGIAAWVVGLVGAKSERFRRVTIAEADLAALTILPAAGQCLVGALSNPQR